MTDFMYTQDIPSKNVELTGNIAENLNEGIGTNYALYIRANSGDSLVEYLGRAPTGSSTAGAVWQIRKIDETTGTIITWADGNDSFDNIWDNRESLSYS